MTVTETMTRIYALLDKHAPKYAGPINTACLTKGKYDMHRGRALSADEKRLVKKMRADGWLYDDIAEHLGVGRTTVYRAMNPANDAH